MEITTGISISFFVCSNLYLLMAFYTYQISPAYKNKVFAVCCILLAIWALGFSFANQSMTMEGALVWRRLSAIGWGLFYSAFLHFNILLTERKETGKMHLSRLSLYLPGLFMVYVFSIYSPIAIGQYNLQRTDTGWANHSINNYFDFAFNVYYVAFLLISIILMIRWGMRGGAQEKKSARILGLSVLAAGILGSITDIIQSSFFPGAFPQMAPIIIMIPISAIFFLIKKMRFISERKEDIDYFEGSVLNTTAREKMMNYLSLFLFWGGSLIVIVSYFLFHDELTITLVLALSCWLFALVNSLVVRSKVSMKTKEHTATYLMIIAILVLILRFAEYSSVTVWALPLFMLSFLSVFDSKKLLIVTFVASEITLLLVWFMKPNQSVVVDSGDHIARLFIVGLSMMIATAIFKAVHARLNESEYRTGIQKMMARIAQRLINTDAEHLTEEYSSMLQLLGNQFDLEYAFLVEKNESKFIYKNEWRRAEREGIIRLEETFRIEDYPGLFKALNEKKIIKLSGNNSISYEMQNELAVYQKFVGSELLLIPMKSNANLLGFLGLAYDSNRVVEHEVEAETLEILGHIFCESYEKKRKDQKILDMALYDQLTLVPNKTLFNDLLARDISLSSRSGKMLGVIFFDIDNFKAVNDTLGHKTGDELIKQVAQRLSNSIRKHDTVARFGGDEFLVLLNNISDHSDLERKVKSIMDTFCDPFLLNDQEYFVTCSAGVSVYPIDGEDSEALIKNADVAMYTSKYQGKNKCSFCTPTIKEDITEKIELTNHLYRALERDELEVYYQPQLCVENKKIVGFEALLRWNHPHKGLLLPGKFISLAENTRLIKPIGKWVMETACQQIANWNLAGLGPLRIAINVSIIQLLDSEILDVIKMILNDTKMDPATIELEITESIAINKSLNVESMLHSIKELGVSISIDDFGTEYSSLARLKTLPIDRIKMDMQFVHSIAKSNKDDAIAKIIIQLAKNLNLKIIAEGIENEMQYKFLSSNACDEVQGFYYYKPMKAKDAQLLLLKQFEGNNNEY